MIRSLRKNILGIFVSFLKMENVKRGGSLGQIHTFQTPKIRLLFFHLISNDPDLLFACRSRNKFNSPTNEGKCRDID